MSPTNFDVLARQRPDLRFALQRLEGWLRSHKDNLIVPSRVARQIQGVDPLALASALMLLVEAGILVRSYKVITPSGVLTDEEFNDISSIPDRMPDRFNSYFDTAEADVTPVFKRREII